MAVLELESEYRTSCGNEGGHTLTRDAGFSGVGEGSTERNESSSTGQGRWKDGSSGGSGDAAGLREGC